MALKTRYSPLKHFTFDNLFMAFADLPPPQKLIALGVTGLLLALILFLPLSLISAKISTLKKEIATSQKGFTQVADKIAEYQKMQSQVGSQEGLFGHFTGSLTTKIDGIANQSGITVDQVKEKAPQETDFLEINSLEIKVSNVSLSQLTEFLFNLENDKTAPMRVRRIEVRPKFNNRQLLDIPSLEVATFSLKKET